MLLSPLEILIAIVAYTLADRAEGISSAIPILGAFALGAQRLLPVLSTSLWWMANY